MHVCVLVHVSLHVRLPVPACLRVRRACVRETRHSERRAWRFAADARGREEAVPQGCHIGCRIRVEVRFAVPTRLPSSALIGVVITALCCMLHATCCVWHSARTLLRFTG